MSVGIYQGITSQKLRIYLALDSIKLEKHFLWYSNPWPYALILWQLSIAKTPTVITTVFRVGRWVGKCSNPTSFSFALEDPKLFGWLWRILVILLQCRDQLLPAYRSLRRIQYHRHPVACNIHTSGVDMYLRYQWNNRCIELAFSDANSMIFYWYKRAICTCKIGCETGPGLLFDHD
jgi:hypothetical protein